jgi:hypothetical protein
MNKNKTRVIGMEPLSRECMPQNHDPNLFEMVKKSAEGHEKIFEALREAGYTNEQFFNIYDEERLGWGNCSQENKILFHERCFDKHLRDCKFIHTTTCRPTDQRIIHHYWVQYKENGELMYESRTNGVHKKFYYEAWADINDVRSFEVCITWQQVKRTGGGVRQRLQNKLKQRAIKQIELA